MSRNSLEERCSVVRRMIAVYKKELMDCNDVEREKELTHRIDLLKKDEKECLKDMGVLTE